MFLIEISENRKVTTSHSNVYPASWKVTLSSDSMKIDLASLLVLIIITYDCIHDDRYTDQKQVDRGTSTTEGNVNNDCHQNIS